MKFAKGRARSKNRSVLQNAATNRNFTIMRLRGVLSLARELKAVYGFESDAEELEEAAENCLQNAQEWGSDK